MAFCSNCGTQLHGDERFCVNCGTNLASAPAATAIPVQLADVPGQLPPGAIPIPVAGSQSAAKHTRRSLMIALILLAVATAYYFVTHQQPAVPSPRNAALAAQQDFKAKWVTANGYVQISNGRWTNHSDVTIESATLQCDEYDAKGSDLDQTRTRLSGPLQPGATDTFDPFQMGAVAPNLSDVRCTIVRVQQPPGQAN